MRTPLLRYHQILGYRAFGFWVANVVVSSSLISPTPAPEPPKKEKPKKGVSKAKSGRW